jgi:hypothetical protein
MFFGLAGLCAAAASLIEEGDIVVLGVLALVLFHLIVGWRTYRYTTIPQSNGWAAGRKSDAMKNTGSIKMLRSSARALAIVTAAIWTMFALLSGAEDGIVGLITNLPNILPFLTVLLATFVAFRRELAGGALLVFLGATSIAFFNAWTSPFVLLGLSLPVTAAGVGLILCHFLDRSDT